MNDALPFGIEAKVIGTEFDSSTSEPVTAADIHEYAASLGETYAGYFGPDPVAPPTFCMKFRGSRFSHPSIPADAFRRGFDAGKDIHFGVPIRPGDVIHTRNALHEVYEKTGRSGSMVFVVSRQLMTNQRGEMVATIDNRFMLRPKADQ